MKLKPFVLEYVQCFTRGVSTPVIVRHAAMEGFWFPHTRVLRILNAEYGITLRAWKDQRGLTVWAAR